MPRTRHARALAIDEPVAALKSTDGLAVPLKGVTAHGRLEGLVFELTVEQRYHNDSSRNLEAVFTFPLPVRAVLLGLDLELGDRRLKAHAVARQQASEEYERAIDEGNTAALIEHDGHGLYTVSLGNLQARETAVIRYRYAELLDAHDGYLRLNVPTVIAPRYGNPMDAGLEGPTVPGVDCLSEYPFEISLDLAHITCVSGLRSPSHEIVTTVREDGLTVRLTRNGSLDRDFVLELDQAAIPSVALIARDGDHYVMLASATLGLDRAEQRPLALKILLDCSGSMGGDSIAAAKRALLAILERLKPADHLSLTRFGSSFEHVTDGLETADPYSLTPLKALVRRMDADLGGTEMAGALEAVLRQPVPRSAHADVILVTDGEVYDVAGVVDLAAKSGHRLFAIAIGAAPNEALARSLADKTGGACEFVAPSEDAEAAILRTFKRLRSNPRTLGPVQWPTTPDWTAPLPTAVFPGDTLHLLAGFTALPTGTTAFTALDAAGQGTTIRLPVATRLTDGDLLPRLAAARRIAALTEDEARKLAVQYQLATEYTSFVVVAERADGEKATDLPTTVAVPYMLAAGWGSSSMIGVAASVAKSASACNFLQAYDAVPSSRRAARPPSVPGPIVACPEGNWDRAPEDQSVLKALIARGQQQKFLTYAEIRTTLRAEGVDSEQIEDLMQMMEDMGIAIRGRGPDTGPQGTPFLPDDQVHVLASLLEAFRRGDPMPTTVAALAVVHGLPEAARSALAAVVAADDRHQEATIVAVFLALLADRPAAASFDQQFVTALKGNYLVDRDWRALRQRLLQKIFS